MSDAPMTLYQIFCSYRTNLGYGFIAALLAVLRLMHDEKPIRTWFFEAAVCAFLAAGSEQLLEVFNLPTKWGYMASVFIGVFGWRVVTQVIKNRMPSGAGRP